MIELIEDELFYILKSNTSSLWCSKIDGSFSVHPPDDIMRASNPTCLGVVHGVIGKLRVGSDNEFKLLLIKKVQNLGTLPPTNSTCLKIIQILVLTLSPDAHSPKDQDIEPCPKHCKSKHDGVKMMISSNLESVKKPLKKTWNQFVNVAENMRPKKLNFKLPPISTIVSSSTNSNSSSFQKDLKEKEKFDRRIMEELQRMFNESDSFYFSKDGDITNSVQGKQIKLESINENFRPFKMWKIADESFFWNKHMLNDLIKISNQNDLANEWIVPVLHGYIQIEECPIKFDEDDIHLPSNEDLLKFKICIISRRSRHRAGTRYKRRGVDEDGHTANFVETEQILEFVNHVVSFVQIRGSVPLFWSQTGMKYKPPPKIERDVEQNNKAFAKHLDILLSKYEEINVINLVDQTGKEKVIADAFLRHVITFNSPKVTYVTFDFHEYCRGMKFENVSILTENIMDIIHDMKYCWVDTNGVICQQQGVFRVNCIDCLDRTNIVQSALARIVLEMQCRKLGLLSPERQLGGDYKSMYQQMWANNGDVISRQYAGTAALKGDYTRTGERKITGVMRDGVNSANRYYINRVKDVYRQATLDLMQGKLVTWDTMDGSRVDGEEGNVTPGEKEEDLKLLIEDCKKLLFIEPEQCIGGWGLVNCDRLRENILGGVINEASPQIDMDIMLFICRTSIYVADYEDGTDSVTSYQKISLQDISHIELGLATFAQKFHQLCLRIYYFEDHPITLPNPSLGNSSERSLCFHSFCVSGIKLFSSGNGSFKTAEDVKEILTAISEAVVSACKLLGNPIRFEENKIDCHVKSRPHKGIVLILSDAQKKVDDNLPDPPRLSELPTPVNLPFKSFQNGSNDLICFDASETFEEKNKNLKPVTDDAPLSETIKEHVQMTRNLQSALKQLVNNNIKKTRMVLHDHVFLSSCGVLATCSTSQLKLGLIREAESSFHVEISNYPEAMSFWRQVSEQNTPNKLERSFNKSNINNGKTEVGSSLRRQLVMLNRQNKSRSLDASNMLTKVKKVEKLAESPIRMSALLEKEEQDFVVVKCDSSLDSQNCVDASKETNKKGLKNRNLKNKEINKVPLINIESTTDWTLLTANTEVVRTTDLIDFADKFSNEAQLSNKNLLNDTSLIMKSASYDFLSDLDDFDFLDQSSTSSTLTKFKKKIVQLTVPSSSQMSGVLQTKLVNPFVGTTGGKINESEQMRMQAKSNVLRSQLRFQYVSSRIILL